MPSIWYTDFDAVKGVKTDESGSVITSFGVPGISPWGFALDSATCLWFTYPNYSLYKLNQTGSVINQQNVSTTAGSKIRDITIDGAGCLWTTNAEDIGSDNVFKRDATFPTSVQTSFQAAVSEIRPITRQADDSLWIGRVNQGTAVKYDQTGSLTPDSFTLTSSEIEGFGIDTNECIWSTDASPAAIEQYDQTGTVVKSFQTTTSDPVGVTTTDEPISSTTGGSVTDTAVKTNVAYSPFQSTEVSQGTASAVKETFAHSSNKAQPAKVWFDTTEQWDSAGQNAVSHASDAVSVTTGEDKGFIIPSQQNWEG